MAIDLNSLCTEFYNDVLKGTDLKGINLNCLRVEAVDGEKSWNDQVQIQDEESPEAQSRVGNHNTSIITTNCTLERAYLIGLNTPLKLPLPEALSKDFGKSLEVNLGSQQNRGTAWVPYHVNYQSGERASSTFRNVTGTGNFKKCQVKLSGKVIFQENSGVREAGIVELFGDMDLLEEGSSFKKDDRNVVFTVSGQCHFKVERQENINYH